MQTDFTLEPGATPLEIARKRKLAEALMREATDTSPVRHWTQGAARLAQALRGVQEDWGADSDQRKYDDYGKKLGGELDGMPAGASGLASALAEPSAPKTPAFVASSGAMAPADLMPHFEAASKATGIPAALLMAQAKQESGFNPNAIGKAGEVGLTQILPSTARQPGFGVQPAEPNELRDPARNIAFGAQYLAARGKAAGVQDWNDPQQAARGLKAYNGGGDPNYVANVTRNLSGGAGQQTLAGGDNLGQTGPSPQRLMAIMSDRNAPPQIRERAKMMYMEAQKNTGPEAELRRLNILKAQKDLNAPDWVEAKDADGNSFVYSKSDPTKRMSLGQGGSKLDRDVTNRTAVADKLNLPEGSQARTAFIATGTLPRNPELTASDRKAILEAEDSVVGIESALTQLETAKSLVPNAYSGFGAGVRGALGTKLPDIGLFNQDRAKATVELDKIMSEEAISQMSATLKGATTDKEMGAFRQMIADPDIPPDLKIKAIDRMMAKARSKLELDKRRAQDMRGQDYFKPGGGQSAAPPKSAAPDPLQSARDAISQGAPRDKVIQRLRENGIDPAGL